MISKRSMSVDSSGIRKVFDLAAKLHNPVDLSIGVPNFGPTKALQQAITGAVEAGKNSYTPSQGIEPLRNLVSSGLPAERNAMITSGVSGGLMLSYLAILDPGDEILIPDPFFCIYRDLAHIVSAKPVLWNTYPSFRVNPGSIENIITPATKAIVIGSPANPTGYSLTQEELDTLVSLAREHDLWLIYDEIYSLFEFDHEHALPDYEKAIVLGGFSKSHGITGWRVGYAHGSEEIIEQMIKLQQYTFVCAPSIAQFALAEAPSLDVEATVRDYRAKRDFLVEALSSSFELETPGGAFYLFPKAPEGVGGSRFVERCIQENLLIVPGNVFSNQDTHFRISFSASQETLERGVEILKRLV